MENSLLLVSDKTSISIESERYKCLQQFDIARPCRFVIVDCFYKNTVRVM